MRQDLVKSMGGGTLASLMLVAAHFTACVDDARPEPAEPDTATTEDAPVTASAALQPTEDFTSCIERDEVLLDRADQRFTLSLTSSALTFGPDDGLEFRVENGTRVDAACTLSARFATELQDGQLDALGSLTIDSGTVNTLRLPGSAMALPSAPLQLSGKLVFELLCFGSDGLDLGATTERFSFHPDGPAWWVYDDQARHERFDDGALTEQTRLQVTKLRQAAPDRLALADGTVLQTGAPQLTFGRAVLESEVTP